MARLVRLPHGWAGEGDDDDEQIPLCRIEYLGDDDEWGFAFYAPPPRATPRPCCAPARHPRGDATDRAQASCAARSPVKAHARAAVRARGRLARDASGLRLDAALTPAIRHDRHRPSVRSRRHDRT